jgi:hypothetical protein
MKIFPTKTEIQAAPNKTSAKTGVKENGKTSTEGKITRKKAELPAKKAISSAEIKEKLAAHVGVSDTAKNMAAANNSKKFGEAFMNADVAAKAATDMVSVEVPLKEEKEVKEEEVKTPNTKDLTLKSDVSLNDPTDTNTQEKLKTALVKGAFNFNPKEREALEKILG